MEQQDRRKKSTFEASLKHLISYIISNLYLCYYCNFKVIGGYSGWVFKNHVLDQYLRLWQVDSDSIENVSCIISWIFIIQPERI